MCQADTAVREGVATAFADSHVNVIVSNAGYGLFGAAEALSEHRRSTASPPTSPAPSS